MYGPHFSGALVGLTWGLLWVGFLIFWVIHRSRERMRLYDLMEKSVQAGQPILPELTQRLTRHRGRHRDLRAGLIFLAIGVGFAITGAIRYFTYAGPPPRMFHGPVFIFPVFLMIGIAFLIMAYIRRNEEP